MPHIFIKYIGDFMKPYIGIIARKSISPKGHNLSIAYDDIISSIYKSGGIPIIIPQNIFDEYIELCKGFIFQGGDDIDFQNLKILKKLRDKNTPVLGICLGMQEIGVLYDGILKNIPNHEENTNHEIKIINNSLLYKILKKEKIIVNSRHKSAIMFPKLKISAISNDNIIEAIYDEKLTFFLGVEWHPENVYDEDVNSQKLFDYFIKICNDKNISR